MNKQQKIATRAHDEYHKASKNFLQTFYVHITTTLFAFRSFGIQACQ